MELTKEEKSLIESIRKNNLDPDEFMRMSLGAGIELGSSFKTAKEAMKYMLKKVKGNGKEQGLNDREIAERQIALTITIASAWGKLKKKGKHESK